MRCRFAHGYAKSLFAAATSAAVGSGAGSVFSCRGRMFRAGKIVIGQRLHADAVGKGLCESSDLFRLIGVVVRHKGIADLKRLAAGVDAAQILKDTAVGAPRGGDVDILIDGFEVIEKSIGAGQQLYGAAADAHRRREKDDFCRQFSVVRAGGVCAPSAAGEKSCGDAGAVCDGGAGMGEKGSRLRRCGFGGVVCDTGTAQKRPPRGILLRTAAGNYRARAGTDRAGL